MGVRGWVLLFGHQVTAHLVEDVVVEDVVEDEVEVYANSINLVDGKWWMARLCPCSIGA